MPDHSSTEILSRQRVGEPGKQRKGVCVKIPRVVMDETLAGALAALFKGPAPASPPGAPAKTALAGPEVDRAREALSHYNGAVQQLKSGNWAGFGAELDALRPLLEELSQHSDGH